MSSTESAAGTPRKSLQWAAALALSCLLSLAAAEGVIRLGVVPPVRQVVHDRDLRLIRGVPVWRDLRSGARENRECVELHPERTRILFFGTSIAFGAGLNRAEDTFPGLLQERLNRLRPDPGFCVLNFAHSGFGPAQQYAVASEELPRYRPALALRQDWRLGDHFNGPAYEMIGGDAYALSGLRRRSDGLPGLRGVPDALNRLLFPRSRLYAWLTLAFGETDGSPEPLPPMPPPPGAAGPADGSGVETHAEIVRAFAALVRAAGAKPAFFIVPDLSYPFDRTSPEDLEWERETRELGRKGGFAVFSLRPALAGEDNAALRLDSWHLNARGHRAVAERLAPFVLSQLDAKAR